MVTLRAGLRWLREGGLPLLLARLCVGGIYVSYGIDKVRHPIAFLKAVHGYDMLPLSPPQLLNVTVVVLPWFEILCGSLLLLGFWRRTIAVLLCGLTLFFTVAVAMRGATLAEAQQLPWCGVRFDCGCGGGEVWLCSKLAENTALIVLAALAAWSRSQRWCLDGALQRR